MRFGLVDEVRLVSRGLPQESVLSSLLYSLYVTELDTVSVVGSYVFQYADNVCVYSPLPPEDGELDALSSTIQRISVELEYRGLSLAPHKTQLCVFSSNDRALRML